MLDRSTDSDGRQFSLLTIQLLFFQRTVTTEVARATVRAKTGSVFAIWAGWAAAVSSAMRPSSSVCPIVPAMADLMHNLQDVIARHSGREGTAISVSVPQSCVW